MTGLMNWVRRAEVRRATAGAVGATFLFAVAGCDSDRASNADERKPIAVTASGVEIMEVTRNPDEGTVEAVVVARGEETRVTFEPLLDGPLPSGVRTTLVSHGESRVDPSFAWDNSTGDTWVRQRAGDDVLEIARSVAGGRAREEYRFNDQSLVLDYADLPPAPLDRATAEFLRGGSPGAMTPEAADFEEQLTRFDAFATRLPKSLTSEMTEAQLLVSLLGDPAFVQVVTGIEPQSDSVTAALCVRFGQCATFFCRFFPHSTICGICLAGVMACIFMEWVCTMTPTC